MPSCTICTHSQRQELEAASLDGASERSIAKQYGVTPAAVHRHKVNHMIGVIQERQAVQADSLIEQVERLKERTLTILDKAEQAADLRAALMAVREARECVQLLARLVGELETGATVNVLVSAEWLEVRAVILNALRPYPDARLAVARALEVKP